MTLYHLIFNILVYYYNLCYYEKYIFLTNEGLYLKIKYKNDNKMYGENVKQIYKNYILTNFSIIHNLLL